MGLSMKERIELTSGGNPRSARAHAVFATLGFSFWVLGVGISMAAVSGGGGSNSSTVCIGAALRWSTLCVGLAFVAVSIAGSCGVVYKLHRLKTLYLVGVPVVLLAVAVLVVFNYVAVYGMYWKPVSACLRHTNTCDGIIITSTIISPDPVQSGCCKPPPSCAFTYDVNGTTTTTTWSPPQTPAGAGGGDCSRWSNDERTLCFQCDSCKASVLGRIKTAWHPIGICITLFLVLSVCLYYTQVQYFKECDKLGL